jgi:hypothetical protein
MSNQSAYLSSLHENEFNETSFNDMRAIAILAVSIFCARVP